MHQSSSATDLLFWCYICLKQFKISKSVTQQSLYPALSQQTQKLQSPIECPYCHQMATEQINEQNHPQQFQTFQYTTTTNEQPSASSRQFTAQHQESQSQRQRRVLQGIMTNLFSATQSLVQTLIPEQEVDIRNRCSGFINGWRQYYSMNAERFANIAGNVGSRPASESALERLQKTQNVQQCAICQDIQQSQPSLQGQIRRSQQLKKGVKLLCGHTFHQICLKPWLKKRNTCPTCREKVQK